MPQTILITGSTDGIGLLTAKLLAAEGHNVLLHGRNAAKLDAAASAVGHNAQTYLGDFSRLADVEAVAAAIRARHDRLDVLINNAGVLKTPDPVAENGLDVRFVVNTLAPYKLTRLLLPIVPSNGRIINLSSAAQASVDLAALAGKRSLGDMEAYSQSKRAIALWSGTLAQELANGPAVIAVNPGSLLASKMVNEGFGVAGNDLRIGAELLVRIATSDSFDGASGRYYDNDRGSFAGLDRIQATSVTSAIDDLLAAA
ncbi:MAG: SDR family NAD(P)-dependent oxidoreductase [Pseudomonadota bacterium]